MPIMRRRRARRRSIRALCVLQKYSPIRSPIMSVVGQSLRIHPASEPTFVRCWSVVSTGRRNTGGQLAINTYDGLPNARPIAFGDSPRNQLSHNTIFSAAPYHYEVTDLSSYTLYLF